MAHTDDGFPRRLAASMERHRPILDRLAENPVDEWMTVPAPPADATTERLIKHDWGWHTDNPDDECPACRVDRGIALLDERRLGWWEDVDVERLDIWDPFDCIYGQVCGSFSSGYAEFGGGYDFGAAAGFYESRILTAIWRRRISERRAR